MTELATRCEEATGPDRELDVLIAEEIGWSGKLITRMRGWSPHNTTDVMVADALHGGSLRGLPAYTASLDAALTLVPKGLHWTAQTDRDGAVVLVGKAGSDARGICYTATRQGTAKTPALALCAAALRAKA